LHLNSLPDYPAQAETIQGDVQFCQSIGGVPENYLVKMKLKNTDSSNMPAYLSSLMSSKSSHQQKYY
jgi:hypothetical protein